jgi:hypothetical protein
MKNYLLVIMALTALICPAFAAEFRGTVTSVNSNDNAQGYAFTAVDASGKVKMFRIDSLAHLDLRDRVIVTYSKAGKFPIRANSIKFLPPAK